MKKTSKKSANHFMNVDYMKDDFLHKFSAYFSILNEKIVIYVLTHGMKKKLHMKYDTFDIKFYYMNISASHALHFLKVNDVLQQLFISNSEHQK